MKKIFTFILLSMIAFNAIHAKITWSLSVDSTLTISGTDMPDYTLPSTVPWNSRRNGIKKVVIKNTVTSIGNYAFCSCPNLTSIIIGNSVTSIGYEAFSRCSRLTSITIGNSVTSIGDYAFQECSSLTSVTIPNSVTSIGERAFSWCTSLTSVTIPNSVTSIGSNVFENCSGLTSVTIPNSVTTIGNLTFYRCSSLTSIQIHNSMTSIGSGAFMDCSGLTSITIPNSVTSIGGFAFYGCTGLTSITIPNSVTSILNDTFDNCSGLTSITIPNSVTSIKVNPFNGCSGLTSIIVEQGNKNYDSRNDCNAIIEKKSNNLIAGCKNTIIPNTVTSIEMSAFNGCSGLTSITIPNSVTSIGDYAFRSCSGLTSITIPNSVTNIEGNPFRSCSGLTSIIVEQGNKNYDSRNDCNAIIEKKSNNLIAGCKNTIIPNTVTSIGSYAFCECSGLTSITIPSTVTSIEDYAFDGCKDLTSITIPNSVTSIGSAAFMECSGLTFITCEAITPPNCQNTNVFSKIDKSIPIYVPANSVDAYKKANVWKNFTNIQAIIKPISISFANENENAIVGETKTLTTTIMPENATNKTTTWTSSNTDVAIVSPEGVVTAKNIGTTIITAKTYNGKTAKCTITVEQPVTAIALSDATTSLWVGKTKTLTATVTPTTSSNTAVNWSSSDNSVATVSSKGVITAKGKGTCTITCTAADGYGTKSTCKVTVKQQVNSIDFGYETLTMTCGDEKTLTPTINPSNADVKTLTWKSTDKSVATITSEGVLTAVSLGTATITCTATDDFKKSSSITVIVESLDITITDKNPTIKEGTYREGGISYTRTLTKNKYTTFCMPYDVNLSDYTEYFSQVYVPVEMAFVKSGGKLMVMFKSVSLTETIRAGQPFIALASKSGTVAIKNGSKVTIASLDEPQPTNLEVYNYGGNLLSRNTDVDVKITGNYSIVTDLDDANNFTFSVNGQMVSTTTVSPYRFYITKNDERSSAKITDILLSFDGEESTGIEDIINEQKGDDKFYNLNGQRINKSNTQKGIYIKNGKKYAK